MEPVNAAAICRLIDALRNPDFRNAFLADPDDALAGGRHVRADLPESLLGKLAQLTESELRLLGDLADTFAGYEPEDGVWLCVL